MEICSLLLESYPDGASVKSNVSILSRFIFLLVSSLFVPTVNNSVNTTSFFLYLILTIRMGKHREVYRRMKTSSHSSMVCEKFVLFVI